MVVDLTKVTYLDSTCLSKIAAMLNQRNASKLAPPVFVVPHGGVRRIFEMVKFDDLFPIVGNLATAMKFEGTSDSPAMKNAS